MRYALIVIVAALLALRVWRHRLARRRVADSSTPTTATDHRGATSVLDRLGGDIGLVARREVRERVRGRTFRVGTLIILLAVAAAVTIPVLRKGGQNHVRVGIVGTLSAPLRITVTSAGVAVGAKVTLVPETSLRSATRALTAGRVDLVLVGTRRIVVDQSLDPSSTSTLALAAHVIAASVSLQAGLEGAGIAPATALRLANPPPLPVQSLKPPQHNQTARTTAVYGLILTYVLLTQFGTWLLMGVMEEKSSRVIEVLLSTLRAGQLLAGKVIGIGAVALLQAGLIVGVALGLGAAEGSTLIHGTAPLGIVERVAVGGAGLCLLLLGLGGGRFVGGPPGAGPEPGLPAAAADPLRLHRLVHRTRLGPAVRAREGPRLRAPHRPIRHARARRAGRRDRGGSSLLSVLLMLVATVVWRAWPPTVYRRAILRTGGRVHLRQLFAADTASGLSRAPAGRHNEPVTATRRPTVARRFRPRRRRAAQ